MPQVRNCKLLAPRPLAPLPADDMVIEYVGELVRHSVSDLRCAVLGIGAGH